MKKLREVSIFLSFSLPLPDSAKIVFKKTMNSFAQPINCIYLNPQQSSCVLKRTAMSKRDVFHALSDPTRRAILCLIAAQGMTPNALAKQFDSSRQAVSKHIQILAECDLIVSEQTGRERMYQLNPLSLREVEVWLKQFKQIWETRHAQLDALLANQTPT